MMKITKKLGDFISGSIKAGIQPAMDQVMEEIHKTQALSKGALVAGAIAMGGAAMALAKTRQQENDLAEVKETARSNEDDILEIRSLMGDE